MLGIGTSSSKTYLAHAQQLVGLLRDDTDQKACRQSLRAFMDSNAGQTLKKNQGGDLVESNIRAQRAFIPYEGIHAKRSKALRAEPVAALYEQGKVHHVGQLPELEDEMCSWDPTDTSADSPNRVDWLVYAVMALLPDVALPPSSLEADLQLSSFTQTNFTDRPRGF